MRAITGFIGFQALMFATGWSFMRAFGLVRGGLRAASRAAGPAILSGTCLVTLVLIMLIVAGAGLSAGLAVAVAVALGGVAYLVGRRRETSAEPSTGRRSPNLLAAAGVAAAGAYVAFGAYALARLPTSGDDARIWSLKGLTLFDYGTLRPEVFQSPYSFQVHPVYPLFQPMLEASLSRVMGAPQLRLMHAELWLLIAAVIWSAGYLLWWRGFRPRFEQLGLAALALLAVTPSLIANVTSGFVDVIGGVLLGGGVLAVGLWLELDDRGCLGLAAVLLAAAANTKNEDLVAVVIVLAVAGAAAWIKGNARRLVPWAMCTAATAAGVIPWRIWTAVHHLSDAVTPPLPKALSPAYIFSRGSYLHVSATAIIEDVLSQWGWFLAVFLAVTVTCLATGCARRVAAFYLASFGLLVLSLVWLYTTTPISLNFLIPTSAWRTIDIFMAMTPFACAHLLSRLVVPFRLRQSAPA
jgi:hypothetical protein